MSFRDSRRAVSFMAGLFVLLNFSHAVAQKTGDKKEKQIPPNAVRVLWTEPGDIAAKDLFLGPGGEAMKPDLSRVTFIKMETGGFSTKYRVKDGKGRTWVVKVGQEARPETSAVRLAWAVGYPTEVNYLVPCVHITGAPKPHKEAYRCETDGHANVRFEARPDDVKRLDNWSWKQNPFVGKPELNGLIVLMSLLNNWDLKDDNNKILLVNRQGGQPELRYIISDLGATFGKTGGFLSRSRNEPEDFVKAKFVEGVEGGRVRLNYNGKQGDLLSNISVKDAKWIGSLLAQLSDQQLQDAFRAANFKPDEIQMLTTAVRERINQLVNLPG
ncbi:MAG TPA: hypothetical protein VJT71_04780 [Pyrinomonadaceae bacterium]|nr:hypothetical protein [Pyrinomonadaceae bacterium]